MAVATGSAYEGEALALPGSAPTGEAVSLTLTVDGTAVSQPAVLVNGNYYLAEASSPSWARSPPWWRAFWPSPPRNRFPSAKGRAWGAALSLRILPDSARALNDPFPSYGRLVQFFSGPFEQSVI